MCTLSKQSDKFNNYRESWKICLPKFLSYLISSFQSYLTLISVLKLPLKNCDCSRLSKRALTITLAATPQWKTWHWCWFVSGFRDTYPKCLHKSVVVMTVYALTAKVRNCIYMILYNINFSKLATKLFVKYLLWSTVFTL